MVTGLILKIHMKVIRNGFRKNMEIFIRIYEDINKKQGIFCGKTLFSDKKLTVRDRQKI
jgi:hypothetical protein